MVASSSRPLDKTLLGGRRAVPLMENPSHANVVDVTNAGTAKLLTLPTVGQDIVGQLRTHLAPIVAPGGGRRQKRTSTFSIRSR